jgi:hypothetical protein
MANMDYPRASLALLESMSSVLDLNLPTGNIEAGTQMVGDQLEQLVTENPEVVNLVGMLEKHFDEEISDEVKEIGGFPSPEDFAFDLEDAGDLLEPSIDTDALAHTIEQFLARTDSTTPPPSQEEEDPGRPRPRHRAPRPWEQDD